MAKNGEKNVSVVNCNGCDESFSYVNNGGNNFTFTYIPSESVPNANIIFTFAQGVNVSGLNNWTENGVTRQMKMDLVEPLRDLFKDEVRKMGVELGLSAEMLNRHPFPGPGLGVRIIGEVSKAKTTVLKEADHIFIQELIKANLYNKVSQAFAVYLPIKSVGVVGDERRYAEVIGLRAVETVDFMTARWAHLPYEFLEHVSNRIVNEIEEVSRVVYDISSKPPATIEWE